ncbi:hypothetical protein B0H21DRAFT_685289, partial [Amylocystis lapponica]
CKDFIQALEACHSNSWAKWTGGCNQTKMELNMCLRKEASILAGSPPLGQRLDRTAKNRSEAKARREKTELVWKDLNEDD